MFPFYFTSEVKKYSYFMSGETTNEMYVFSLHERVILKTYSTFFFFFLVYTVRF